MIHSDRQFIMAFNWAKFLIALALLSILVILQVVYLSKLTNDLSSLASSGVNVTQAKSDLNVAAGITYFFAACMFLLALWDSFNIGAGATRFRRQWS